MKFKITMHQCDAKELAEKLHRKEEDVMTELNRIDIQIGDCRYHIAKAIDTQNSDMFNEYYRRLERLYNERKEILKLSVIGG